eukprot:g5402.t1
MLAFSPPSSLVSAGVCAPPIDAKAPPNTTKLNVSATYALYTGDSLGGTAEITEVEEEEEDTGYSLGGTSEITEVEEEEEDTGYSLGGTSEITEVEEEEEEDSGDSLGGTSEITDVNR